MRRKEVCAIILWSSALIVINFLSVLYLTRGKYNYSSDNSPGDRKGISEYSIISNDIKETENVIHNEKRILKDVNDAPRRENILVELVSNTEDWQMKELFNRTVQCPGTNKTISFHRSFMDFDSVSRADVVCVISGASPETWRKLQGVRNPDQIWLYSTAESPISSPPFPWQNQNGKIIAKYLKFNMSFGYHPKFDVYAPFGAYVPWNEEQKQNLHILKKSISPKPRADVVVAWASSHCHYDYWNRTNFAQKLSKYLPVHMYGACGDKLLPRNVTGTRILKKYKFYLAFENICCSYYISEKFWLALADYEAVPIVVGASRAEYEKIAPPNSFIYADDFVSFEELARYVIRVANNNTLYNEFHEWRKFGYAEVYHSHRVFPYCDDKMSCKLLDYLEKEAWRPDNPLSMALDLYGPDVPSGIQFFFGSVLYVASLLPGSGFPHRK